MKEVKNYIIDWLIRINEFILVFIVILDCNSVYRHRTGWTTNPSFLALKIAIGAAYIMILLWLLKDKKNIECIKDIKVFFIINFLFVFEFNASKVPIGSEFVGYFLFFVTAMMILFRIYKRNGDAFHLLFLMENVVLFIAVVSVILWIGWNFCGLWGMTDDLQVNWGGTYYDANYLNISIRRFVLELDSTKNLGIFVEPPMFGLFLGFGLYTELFLKKKSNPIIVVSFVIALLSCRAILALMLMFVAIFFVLAEKIKNSKVAKILIPGMVIVCVISVTCLATYKYKNSYGSMATHIDDFVASIKCWLKNPISGCGYDNEYPIREYMSSFRSDNRGLSNSAAVVLAEGGLVLFTYYFLPFLFMMKAFFKKNHKLAYWGIGMFLFWVVVIFHVRLFVFFILAFGYSMIDFKVHFSRKVAKKVEFSIREYNDNIGEDGKIFETGLKRWLDIPVGIINMFFAILNIMLIVGIVAHNRFSKGNFIVSIILLLASCIVTYLFLSKKQLTVFKASMFLFCLLGSYMLIGQPYQIMDYMLSATHMRIQDGFYSFSLLVIVLFGIGTTMNILYHSKKNIYD